MSDVQGSLQENMGIVEHFETHLGPIERGWSVSDGPQGVQACRFQRRLEPDLQVYATLGLSSHVLKMMGGRVVRQELVLAVHAPFATDGLSGLLLHISERLLRAHGALLRGEVVPLDTPVVRGAKATHLYASMPVVFPDSFATFTETSPPTILVWLFPVLPDEAEYISVNGWSAFEDLLEQEDPDLFDVKRGSVVRRTAGP